MNLRKLIMLCMFGLLASWTLETSVYAGGFRTGAATARMLGLGGASSGLIGDHTGLSSNAASLSFAHGTNLALGATVTMPDYEFEGVLPSDARWKMKPQAIFPPSVALSHTFRNGLGFGVSASIPYQVKTSWGDDWVGSPIVISSEIRAVELAPTLAFRIGRTLAFGVGVQATFIRMDHSRRNGDVIDTLIGRYPSMSMTGSADVAYGFNLGLMYSPHDMFAFGVALKSKCTGEIGNGSLSYAGNANGAGTISGASFATTLTMPEQVRAGVMLRPIDGLLLTGEAELTRWSGVKGVTILLGSPVSTVLLDQSGWKDVIAYRAGIELTIADVILRAGVGKEPSPVPDADLRPSIPDADGFHYNLGLGYAVEEGLVLDLGLQLERYADRTVTDSNVQYATGKYFNGTYIMSSTIFAITLSYSWK